MVELKNFYSKQCDVNTPEKNIQSFVPNTNRSDGFNSKSSNRMKNNALDAVINGNDDDSLARFIEDNYQYFKKQNNFANLSTTSAISINNTCQVNSAAAVRELQSLARSDPEFLLFKNSLDCCDATHNSNYMICRKKMRKTIAKKNKMSAMSDSDFIVSLNDKSRKLTTFKSKISFKTILNGKFPRCNNNKYNMLDHPPTATMTIRNIASTITSPPTIIYPTAQFAESMNSATSIQPPELTMNNRRCSLNTNLSKSLNGFYCNTKYGNKPLIPIQRFSSEDNSTTAMNNEKWKRDQTQPPCDAIDLFLRLYQQEESNKNLCDDRSIDKFNSKFVLNSTINGVSEMESISSKLSPHVLVNQANVSPQQNYLGVNESSEWQSIKLNEDNLTSSKCHVSGSSHDVTKQNESTLNNSNVVNGAKISDEIKGSKCNDRFTKKVNLKKNLSEEVNTVICKLPLQVNVNAVTRMSKTDEIISYESMQSKYTNKNDSHEMNRARKQSVTYDINVIHRSQNLRIDEICPQPKSSFAIRSGSMASASKYFGFVYFSKIENQLQDIDSLINICIFITVLQLLHLQLFKWMS